MQNADTNKRRSVVPRWRSLARTPEHELQLTSSRDSQRRDFAWRLDAASARWTADATLENAVDLLDTAVAVGHRDAARDVAVWIRNRADEATPAVLASAGRALKETGDAHRNQLSAAPIRTNSLLQRHIAELKHRLVDQPRDAISSCELSRLYTIAGQKAPALRWMERATALAPNDRYVLRSAAQLFAHFDAPADGLAIIWKSSAVRHDPWVQAAEVALADKANAAPKWAHKQRAAIASAGPDVGLSELAVGLGSLEEKAGAGRRVVRRLLEKGLARPTENALAQAIWLGARTGIDFGPTKPSPKLGFAGEAKALSAIEARDYATAMDHCEDWIADEPYSLGALACAGGCADVFLREHEKAITFFRRAIELNPEMPMLHNGLLVACASAGELEAARQAYAILEIHREDRAIRPYLHAARGLIAFKSGDVELGRQAYMEAIEACGKLEGSILDLSATIYWVEQEADLGLVPPPLWETFQRRFDARVQKATGPDRHHVRRLWAARRELISAAVRQTLQTCPTSDLASALASMPQSFLS